MKNEDEWYWCWSSISVIVWHYLIYFSLKYAEFYHENWIRHVCYPEKEEALFYYVKINAIKKAWVTPNKQKLKQLTQQPPTNTEQELHPGNEAKEWNIGPKRSAVFFFGLSCARCNNCGSHEDKLVIGVGSLPFSFFFDMSQALPFSFDVELLEKFFFFQIAKASSPELGSQKEPGQQEQRSSNEWDSRDWSGLPNFFFFLHCRASARQGERIT